MKYAQQDLAFSITSFQSWLFILYLVVVWDNCLIAQSPHGDKFKIDCAQCHSPDSWTFNKQSSNFDHNKTNFELKGQHTSLECKTCHTNLSFTSISTQCNSCHIDIHQQTVGSDCSRCHNTQSWIVQDVTDMHERALFPLLGMHSTVDCNQCHVSESNLRFDPLEPTCISCHTEDYTEAKNPDHLANNFNTDCTLCHSVSKSDWLGGISHSFFPLEQGHDISECTRCHVDNNFSLASPECFSCHQQDYSNTASPNHINLGFDQNCSLCHTLTPGWKPAKFPNHNDYYVLEGAHAKVSENCIACHHGSYTNTPNTCFGCHESEYTATNNPSHSSSGFPKDCTVCHTQNAWQPATLDHDGMFFPIYSGKHKGEWNQCNDCHTEANNYSNFNCLNCHKKNDTDDEHDEVGAYMYQSNACFTCHPDGKE